METNILNCWVLVHVLGNVIDVAMGIVCEG